MNHDKRPRPLQGIDPGQLLDSLHDGVYYVDQARRILYWNEAAERISGFRRDEVVESLCFNGILGHVDDAGTALCQGDCPLARTLRDGRRREERLYLHHKDGHRVAVSIRVAPVFGPGGAIIGAVESFSDDSWREDLHERVTELERMTLLDPLTGLLNRRGLEQAIEARLDEHRRYGWPFGVLLVDLDNFKAINDRLGHDVGDRMLRMVARTLTAGARAFDTVGRWGGEEFLVCVANVEPDRLLSIAERICRLIEHSELRESGGIRVTGSIGAASIEPGESMAELVQRADALMYEAKRAGGNRVSS